jgi:hypothetical protein
MGEQGVEKLDPPQGIPADRLTMGAARQVVEGLLPRFLEVCKVRFSTKLSLSLFAIFFVQRAIFVNEKGDVFLAMMKKGLQATQIERERGSAYEGLNDEGQVWI